MDSVRNVVALLVLGEERHFGRAAARLMLTQPALTRRIQALEAEVGMRLVERSTREVALTDAARRFIPRAREGLDRLNGALRDLKAEASGLKGFLKIAYNRIALHGPFIQLVRSYREQFPDVQVDLVFMPSHEQVTDIEAGALDAGFVVGPLPPALETLVVDQEKLVAVLPDGHPLMAGSIPLSALADEPFVLGDRHIWQTYLPIVHDACARAGFAPRIVQEAGTSEALLALVAAGTGVTLYLRGHGPWAGTTYVDLADCGATAQTVLVWRRGNQSPHMERFLAIARKAVEARRIRATAEQRGASRPRRTGPPAATARSREERS